MRAHSVDTNIFADGGAFVDVAGLEGDDGLGGGRPRERAGESRRHSFKRVWDIIIEIDGKYEEPSPVIAVQDQLNSTPSSWSISRSITYYSSSSSTFEVFLFLALGLASGAGR